MIDFLNDIMEAMTKKHIIIGTLLLAFVIGCIVAIIVLCSSTRDISSSVKVERTSEAEVYTVEIESAAEVSAESIYHKLASSNRELKLMSMESDKDPHVVSLSADTVSDSSLEIYFADGNFKKNFLNTGEYDETLIIYNQADQSMSSLTVKLMVTRAVITTITDKSDSKADYTSRTSRATVSSTAVTTIAPSIADVDYEYDDDDDYEYNYDYDYIDEYDYYDNYVELGYDQSDNDVIYKEPETEEINNVPTETATDTDSSGELNFETAEDFGWTGAQADWFNYAISQGCNVWQASAYANACSNYGEENIFIGLTPEDSTCWGVWYYDVSTETYRAA